jgi:hypothetical protein
VLRAAVPLGLELCLGLRPRAPQPPRLDGSLYGYAGRFARRVRDLSHEFKVASKVYQEKIIDRQAVQARLADAAIWLHGWAAVLSKLDRQIRDGELTGDAGVRDRRAAEHFMELADLEIAAAFRALRGNHADGSMLSAADAALRHSAGLPNDRFVIPERSPSARGTGRVNRQDGIKQFPGDSRPGPAGEDPSGGSGAYAAAGSNGSSVVDSR